MIRSMGSIMNVAHASVAAIFTGPVEITEKVDGSFFSFGRIDGELQMRSKGQELHYGSPNAKMFNAGMEYVMTIQDALAPGWIYRGEYLAKPKHNTLCYDRAPDGHVVLFDIETDLGAHAGQELRGSEAIRLGFTAVPVLFEGPWDRGFEDLKSLLETTSILGGQKIEGVVVKNFGQYLNGHVMMGKLVSEQFKEVHNKEWKVGNPGKKDVVEELIDSYRVPARWRKAIQHLAEAGTLENSPRDIGPLLKEISQDILKEEEDAIKEKLFKSFWPQIARGVSRGFPEWYKDELLKDADVRSNESTSQPEEGEGSV